MDSDAARLARPNNIEALILRVGLVGASLLFFDVGTTLWAQGQPLLHPVNLVFSITAWTVAALTGILSMSNAIQRWHSWLILISFVALELGSVQINAQTYTPLSVSHTDNEMIAKYALEALKHGQNPYSWNFADITRVYRDMGLNLTPFLDGTYQNRPTYPALPTLVLWLFDRIGLGEVRSINLIANIGLLILVFSGIQSALRPIILLPIFMFSSLPEFGFNGGQDIVWCVLLVGCLLAWRHPMWRAVLFGLAASYRQQPWFIAPFLLISLWYEPGAQRWRRLLYFVGIGAAIFLLTNLPFMLWDFRNWQLGVFEPLYAQFNVYSQGLGILSSYGLLALPREFYTVLQAAFFAAALLIHWRYPRAIGPTFLLFPAVFFWLYYRGLASYWVFWLPPFLIAIANNLFLNSRKMYRSRLGTLTIIGMMGVIAAIPLTLALVYLRQPPLIDVNYHTPLTTLGNTYLVSEMTLTVTNHSDAMFRPRFAVQREPGGQALPWTILSGPESLKPGSSADYTISADGIAPRTIAYDLGGQVVVMDADGDNRRRAVLTIPASSNADDPDAITNPAFAYWPAEGSLPQGWALDCPAIDRCTWALKTQDGREGLGLNVQNTAEDFTLDASHRPVRLSQNVTFGDALTMWIYPTGEPDLEYAGIEIDDGSHKLWVVFGTTVNDLRPGNGIADAILYLRVPWNSWSRQTIDVQGLYMRLRWPLPTTSPRGAGGLLYFTRQVKLSLIAVSGKLESNWLFGPFEQTATSAMKVDQRVDLMLAHPDEYYVNIGDTDRWQRNFDLAVTAYARALAYNVHSGDAYFGLGQSRFALGDWAGATEAFHQALSNGFSRPDLARQLLHVMVVELRRNIELVY